MANSSPTGRAASLSMADFNARAKRIAAETGAVEKGATRRPTPSRFRRDNNAAAPAASAAPEKDEPAGESN